MISIDERLAVRILALFEGMEGSRFCSPHFFDLATVHDGIRDIRAALAQTAPRGEGAARGGTGDSDCGTGRGEGQIFPLET